MCGRYTLIANISQLAERFAFDAAGIKLNEGYNIAPSQMILAVKTNDNGDNRAQFMRWGLTPFWARNDKMGSRMINARSETIHMKRSFSSAFRSNRCIIPADGFYEWLNIDGMRQPIRMSLRSHELFAFAGLWETWENPKGNDILSCTIVTAPSNDLLRPIHNRMPFILAPEAETIWLKAGAIEPSQLSHLLDSRCLSDLEAHEVSTIVNSPTNNLPQCAKHLCRVF